MPYASELRREAEVPMVLYIWFYHLQSVIEFHEYRHLFDSLGLWSVLSFLHDVPWI